MSYSEDEYLMISGIQHFVFCKRQWALLHIEQQWNENYLTVDGNLLHRNAHDGDFTEMRRDVIVTRSMPVSSSEYGISGECDIVEFHKSKDGICLFGREGKYSVIPVEYKRGRPIDSDCNDLQLIAQAVCIEEMLCCSIPYGYMYYGQIRRRVKVEFADELRVRLSSVLNEMHRLYKARHTPVVKKSRSCNACSMNNLCLPSATSSSASEYIKNCLKGDSI